MACIAETSIFFPLQCRLEHRRVGLRFVVFLPRGEAHRENGKNSRSFTYRDDAVNDADTTHNRTERRARLMAAAWACWHVTTCRRRGLTDEEVERCEECVGVELSLVL